VRYGLLGLSVSLLFCAVACSRDSSKPQTVGEALATVLKYPEGWSATDAEALRLFQQGKKVESTALYQTVVDAHPDFAEARYSLAANHEFMAEDLKGDPGRAEARNRHLETAAIHYKRFRELKSDPLDRAIATSLLVSIYGPQGLNQIDEARAFAQHYIEEKPASAHGYGMLAAMLRVQGATDRATEVLLQAFDKVTADERDLYLAEHLVTHVKESPNLTRATAERFISEALAGAERQIPIESTHGLGLINKANALEVRAARLEQDPAKRKALAAEARRLHLQGLDGLAVSGKH
jgi:hypothetical protein